MKATFSKEQTLEPASLADSGVEVCLNANVSYSFMYKVHDGGITELMFCLSYIVYCFHNKEVDYLVTLDVHMQVCNFLL